MKVDEALRHYTKELEAAGISTARLDCLVLLEDILSTNRTQLLAQPERILTDKEYTIFCIVMEKRTHHIPLAYIRQKTEFYSREFYVDERVLEPRPESETMIDLLKDLKLRSPKIADVGSGSGALGITAKLEIPTAHITLLEIDNDALAVTRKNIRLHKIKARTIKSDLLTDTSEHYDVLLCNLPYVPEAFKINTAASHEPRTAIFGGVDGLDLYRRLFRQIQDRDNKPEFILTESLPAQHHRLATLAREHGYTLERTDDFIQLYKRM